MIFDEPVELSLIRIWNYGKTPSRGVRDIAVCIWLILVSHKSDQVLVWLSSGVRCRLFAYGPADATASHHLLPHLNPDWFYLSGTGLPRLSWERGC